MIQLVPREQCNGCMACYNICPKNTITVSKDNAGFLYPQINYENCISCGKCVKVCTVLHTKKADRFEQPKVMAAYSKDLKIRMESTSGGIFSVLANEFFDNNSFVSGAVYTKSYLVRHIVTDDRNKLPALRSSKYLQSDFGNVPMRIKELLHQGKEILVCGAPCQVMGLYNYLGKDYDNLTTCDFICRGVNSPWVFQEYLKLLEKKYHSKVTKIKFKNKTYGWHFCSTKISFQNKKHYIADRYTDKFMRGYLESNLFMRESCYSCPYKELPRVSDITLADFWGVENAYPEMDQDLGTSMVMLNSEKGKEIFNKIKGSIVYKEATMANVKKGNPSLFLSPQQNKSSYNFMEELKHVPFEEVWSKYLPDNAKEKQLKLMLKRNILRIKLLRKNTGDCR